MTKKLEIFAFALFAMFGLAGAVLTSIVFHEYTHAYDFKEVAQNDEICGLVLPKSADDVLNSEGGYYKFGYKNNPETIEKVENIQKYTELKAYSITFFVLLLFVACFSILTKRLIFPTRIESNISSKDIIYTPVRNTNSQIYN